LTLIKIFIIDNNPGFINAAKRFLSTKNNVSIIGFAISGKEALDHLKGLSPDIILIDYVMEGLNGIDTIKAIKRSTNTSKIIMVTQHNITEYKVKSLEAGADGFIYKPEFGTAIFSMIEQLLNGNNGTS
jgi:DNA-binding NarL/FixJ family response regulator